MIVIQTDQDVGVRVLGELGHAQKVDGAALALPALVEDPDGVLGGNSLGHGGLRRGVVVHVDVLTSRDEDLQGIVDGPAERSGSLVEDGDRWRAELKESTNVFFRIEDENVAGALDRSLCAELLHRHWISDGRKAEHDFHLESILVGSLTRIRLFHLSGRHGARASQGVDCVDLVTLDVPVLGHDRVSHRWRNMLIVESLRQGLRRSIPALRTRRQVSHKAGRMKLAEAEWTLLVLFVCVLLTGILATELFSTEVTDQVDVAARLLVLRFDASLSAYSALRVWKLSMLIDVLVVEPFAAFLALLHQLGHVSGVVEALSQLARRHGVVGSLIGSRLSHLVNLIS